VREQEMIWEAKDSGKSSVGIVEDLWDLRLDLIPNATCNDHIRIPCVPIYHTVFGSVNNYVYFRLILRTRVGDQDQKTFV